MDHVTPRTLCLLSCGKSKLPHAAKARDLYTGCLFRDALAYATHPGRFDDVRILSAKHGLLTLDQVVEPYDLKLSSLDRAARAHLTAAVGRSLAALWTPELLRPWCVDVLAGQPYIDVVHAALDGERFQPRPCVNILLGNLSTGGRRAWFKKAREAQP